MSVAVIIPNRNYGQYLDRCLWSVAKQTVPADDVIVVDGYSSDISRKVYDSHWKKGYSWIDAPPRGMANARNVGIQATDARFILPLDADDWLEPDYIERCLDGFMEPPTPGGWGPKVGVVAPALRWPDGRVQQPKPPFTVERFLTGNLLFSCSMFRRQCWEDVGGYSEDRRLFEDWDMWARIVAAGWHIAAIPDALFHYCPHPGSSCDHLSAEDNAAYCRRTIEKLRAAVSVPA